MAEAQRSIEAAMTSAEHAYGEDWKHQVEVRADKVTRRILNEGDETRREQAVLDLVHETTGLNSAVEFVGAIEASPRNPDLFLGREELSQCIAMALSQGSAEQQAALASGDEARIYEQLPGSLAVIARDVRDVVVEPEVGERINEMEFYLSETPGSPKDDARIIEKTIDGIRKWMDESGVERGDKRRGGTMRVVGMLQIRGNQLMEESEPAPTRGGRRERGRRGERPPEIPPGRPPLDQEGEEPGEWKTGNSWDMSYEDFVRHERKQMDPNWYSSRPPEWFKEMSEEEKELIEVRIKLLKAAADKREVRNKLPVEKLRGGVVPEIDGNEFSLLWERMPGFKEAMGFIVKDICERYVDPADGRVYLRLKNTNGVMDPEVFKMLDDFKKLRAMVAGQVAEKLTGRESVAREVDIEAVSAAWNFLFVGDSIEAWDYFRQLKPTWICSDKLRTAYHLRSKALGKWRIWKASGELGEEGEEEPFVSTNMAVWVLDRLKYESGFADRILRGDLREILPDTLAVSMIEAAKVKLRDGTETTLAMALWDGRANDVVINTNDRNVFQVHNDMVQGADFLAAAIKGKQPLDMAKNGDDWVGAYVESTGLTRQVPTIPQEYMEGGVKKIRFTTLPCVDRPMFIWSVLLNSMGFDPYSKFPLLPERKLNATSNNYDLRVKNLVGDMAIRSTVNKEEVRGLFGARGFWEYKKRKLENTKEGFKRAEGL
jgi:hypothetical protein